MEEIIIKELKATPKKTLLKFKISQHDPYDRVLTFDKPLPPTISSHLQAVADFVKEEADALLSEDLRQEVLPLDEEIEDQDEEVEVDEEGVVSETDGMEDEESPEEDPEDYANMALPVIENTEMPNYREMEKGHVIWYVNNSDKDVLIEDVKFNFNQNLSPTASLKTIREQVIELAAKELKWK